MNYRPFSDLGWNVSEVGLGCWQIGWCWGDVSETDSKTLLKEALNQGINFFDTSDMYGDGRSEKFLGDLIKSTREKIYVTTKLGRRTRGTNYVNGFKEEHMEEFVDRSLKNLGVDCIDLVQLHCPPNDKIIHEKTHNIMNYLIKKGKVSNYGVSVHTISDAMEAIKFKNVKSIQIVFNIFRQRPIEKFLIEAKKKNIAVIARGPLASGLLTGKINKDTKFAENDHRNYNINGKAFDIGDTFSGVNFEKGLEAVEQLKKILPKDFTLSQLALKWILLQDGITVTIPGAINENQVNDNTDVSKMKDIHSLVPQIKNIYDKYIKEDVHNKWL